jgi:DNA-directed RNA polymerase subunit M/transcription elongation factor TFIIS
MVSFFCPFCKHVIKAAEDAAGTLIACEKCKLEIRVPQPAAPVSAGASAQPSVPWWKRLFSRGGQHTGTTS